MCVSLALGVMQLTETGYIQEYKIDILMWGSF